MSSYKQKVNSISNHSKYEVIYAYIRSTVLPIPRIPPARVLRVAEFQVHAGSVFLKSLSQNVFLETYAHRYTGSLGYIHDIVVSITVVTLSPPTTINYVELVSDILLL